MTLAHCVSTMSKLDLPKKKLVLPYISPETLALPGIAEYYAAAQQLTDQTNANYDECRRLLREIADLKRAKKKASARTR